MLASLASAQQQTGAPAGIPVPPVPSESLSAGVASGATYAYRVRLLDGRNGSPIAGGHVRLWYDEPTGTGYEVATDAHGVALMPAPVGEPVRVLLRSLDGKDCRRSDRYDVPAGYNLAAIARNGMATENTCGDAAVRTKPGELVIFVRPEHWYERLNRTPDTTIP